MMQDEAAPAKVNLALHVTGRRDDGYHLLDSVVVFTTVGDVVSLHDGTGLILTGPESAGLDPSADNLVSRAAKLMGADGQGLALDKRLPVSSGIGGGSSDAAATLRMLARAMGRALPTPEQQLALGADVPVCVAARPTRMRGIGDVLGQLPPIPRAWLVLVNPRVTVSTPAIFRALTQRDNPPMEAPSWGDFDSFAQWLGRQRNDLQQAAIMQAPSIALALASLSAQPGCALARMSGSGATCFGLFATQDAAEAAAAAILRAEPGWWVTPTAILD